MESEGLLPARSEQGLDRPSRAARLRRLGRFNAAAYIGASAIVALEVVRLPGGASTEVRFALAAGFAFGILCLVLPWERLPVATLHVPPPLASTLLAVSMSDMQREASLLVTLYMLNAAGTAYWYASRRWLAAQLAYMVVAMIVGLAHAGGAAFAARTAIVAVPTVVLAALLAGWMTEQLRARKRAYRQLAELDPLTGIANRRALVLRIEEEIERHRRLGQRFALLLLDLDGFKQVNERLGHRGGDEFLRTVAATLRNVVRADDLVARPGGDEFAILVRGFDRRLATALADRVSAALEEVGAGASVGVAVHPDDGRTLDELLRAADEAEREAKRLRRRAGERPGYFLRTNAGRQRGRDSRGK
jgi:diguanylate cyclase (GGDEF)-like protein